ncbi:uncharacterized protein PAE49_005815 isoform 2-T2 [Odontesthes bonariensis]|uniref:uncharacterized protein LOC142380818 isoform X2 n=1 Tax=Odontesthes bonariensis TaxID=219752 RepID=UPI003F58570F
MIFSAKTQKGCILIFLQIFWSAYIFSGNAATHHLRFWLGCRAVIPCRCYSTDSDCLTWFYKKDELSAKIKLFFQDMKGVQYHGASQCRACISQNRSLVIKRFAEDNQGTYWCENCNQVCRSEHLVIREILNETRTTFLIAAGSSFKQTCPGGFPNVKWTFQASNTTAPRSSSPRPVMITSDKSIQIANIKSEDAGKYTCWASYCGDPSQKLLTINLSVTTEPSRSLTSNASQMLDGHATVTRGYISPTEFYKTAESKNLMPAIYGIAVPLACLILMALFILCLRSRMRAAFCFNPSCCDFNDKVEEESQVVYSSIVIRTPAKTRDSYMTRDSDCVYSEIKV